MLIGDDASGQRCLVLGRQINRIVHLLNERLIAGQAVENGWVAQSCGGGFQIRSASSAKLINPWATGRTLSYVDTVGEAAHGVLSDGSTRKDAFDEEFGPVLAALLPALEHKPNNIEDDLSILSSVVLVEPHQGHGEFMASGNAEAARVVLITSCLVGQQTSVAVVEHDVEQLDKLVHGADDAILLRGVGLGVLLKDAGSGQAEGGGQDQNAPGNGLTVNPKHRRLRAQIPRVFHVSSGPSHPSAAWWSST